MCSHSQGENTVIHEDNQRILTPELIEKLCGDDELKKKHLKLIEFEYVFWKQEGKVVPSKLSELQWEDLMLRPSRSSRSKYLEFLYRNEKLGEKEKAEKEERRKKLKEHRETRVNEGPTDNPHHYGLNFNTIFMRVYDTKMDHFHNSKCISAMMHAQPLVFDMGFDEDLTSQEQKLTSKQMAFVFNCNRVDNEPFNLHLLNCNHESLLMRSLKNQIPTLYQPDFPVTISSKSYLDLYPKEKLVYLTPHTREEMTSFDHDSIYIVGGIVDRQNNVPLTMAKAKRENIRMAKLPLDRYLPWGACSSKSLTLDAIVKILLELKKSGSWEKALTHIPKRKIKTEEEIQLQQRSLMARTQRAQVRY